jgi:hypothetical protein
LDPELYNRLQRQKADLAKYKAELEVMRQYNFVRFPYSVRRFATNAAGDIELVEKPTIPTAMTETGRDFYNNAISTLSYYVNDSGEPVELPKLPGPVYDKILEFIPDPTAAYMEKPPDFSYGAFRDDL